MAGPIERVAGRRPRPAPDLSDLSPAAVAAVDEATDAADRAGRYAVVAVALSFLGNGVHLVSELTHRVTLAEGAAVVAEAMFGPALVLVCSHLLMHADGGRRLERWPLWVGFVAGASLSSVHLWAVAFTVLSTGILADVGHMVPYLAAALLPLGVEGASIGSIQQAARHRARLDRFVADRLAEVAERAEAERAARAEAEAEHARRIELEHAEAERAERAAEAERQLIAERKAAAEAVVTARKESGGSASAEDTETAVAAFLAANAGERNGKGPTLKAVAEALGVVPRTVQRSKAWTNRTTTPLPQPDDAEGVDLVDLLDQPTTANGADPTTELETIS